MSIVKTGLACYAFVLALLGSATANATYLYDNVSVASGGVASASTGDNGPLADSFSTRSSGYTLTAVDLLVIADNPADGGSFTVSLLSDNSTSPGSTITMDTFVDSALSTTLGTFYAPFSNVPLAANTRYWIELSTSNGSLEWSYSQVNNGIGVANEYNFYAGSVSANAAFTPYQMSVGSAVPERSSWAMMLLGLAGLGFANYRTSSQALSVTA